MKFLSILVIFFLIPCSIFAKPTKPQVVQGSARCEEKGAGIEIHATDRAIIHWEEFSIQKGEVATFVQPSAQSAVLNRVAKEVSHIDGLLQANGKIYLVNPNGILIGPSGKVQAEGFIASTLDLENEHFFKNKELLFKGASKAGIVNLGKIEAIGGDVFLLAKAVINEGTLEAEKGVVGLAVGEEILLKPAGMQRLFIIPHLEEEKEEKGIENQGKIQAAHTELVADGNAFRFAINQRGIVEATGTKEENGRVFLIAEKGTAVNCGEIYAKGGKVAIFGDQVGVHDLAIVDVSSEFQGGEVTIGGNFQGKNPQVQNATTSVVMKGGKIFADAIVSGNGGNVVVWSDGMAIMEGEIFARGGSEGGNGGNVEVSGLKYLEYCGHVDTSAPKGVLGELLLDPSDITINNVAANVNINFNAATGVYTATAATGTIDTTGSMAALFDELDTGTTNITVNTTSGFSSSGTVTFSSGGSWTTGNSLTVNADSDIVFSGGETITSVSGSFFLNAQRDIIFQGPSTEITSSSGRIEFDAGRNIEMRSLVLLLIETDLGGLSFQAGGDIIMGLQSGLTGEAFIQAGSQDFTLTTGGDFSIFGSNVFLLGKEISLGAQVGSIQSRITVGGNLTLRGGSSDQNFVSIGGRGTASRGDIFLNVGGNVVITGGQSALGYAQIGYFQSLVSGADAIGDIVFEKIGGDLVITGGSDTFAPAQIGHANMNTGLAGGFTATGDVLVNGVVGNITLQADASTAIIGHGNLVTPDGSDVYSGSISVETLGNIQVLPSTLAPAAIGFLLGGTMPNTVTSDGITISAKSLSLISTAQDAYIGYSDRLATAVNSVTIGPITINTTDDTLLEGVFVGASGRGSALIAVENGTSSIATIGARNITVSTGAILIDSMNLTSEENTVFSNAILLGNGEILSIAGVDQFVQNISSITSSLGSVTLVVDNKEPDPYDIGEGRFILDASSSINAASFLRIFTARPSQNKIEGTLNGNLFVPGPGFINTSTEQWGTYFPSDIGGIPFTIFYKTGLPRSIYNEIGSIFTEMFQNLKTYDSLLFVCKCFLLGYDKACYDQFFLPKGKLSSFDLFGDRKTTMLRQLYRNYQTKSF